MHLIIIHWVLDLILFYVQTQALSHSVRIDRVFQGDWALLYSECYGESVPIAENHATYSKLTCEV